MAAPATAAWLRLRPAAAGPILLAATSAGVLSVASIGCSTRGSSLAVSEGGAAPGGATTSSTSSGGAAGEGGAGASGGEGGDPEPAGPPRLTVVNGTVDATEVRVCFVPYPPGGEPGGSSQPWPGSSSLSYATAEVIDPSDGVVPTDTDVEVVLLSGVLEPTYDAGCAEILAGPPGGEPPTPWPTISHLGVLPESALVAERSLLLVTVGCVGGEEHTDMVEALACGADYTPTQPTASVVAASMSRFVVENRVGMQFAQASVAMPIMDVRVRPGIEAASATVAARNWTLGAIAPYPPLASFSRTSLGNVADAEVQLYQSNNSDPAHFATFGEIFAASALEIGQLADGDNIVFVAVGSMPGLSPGDWWHELRYVVVAADPG